MSELRRQEWVALTKSISRTVLKMEDDVGAISRQGRAHTFMPAQKDCEVLWSQV